VRNGLPELLLPEQVGGLDRLMRGIYDGFGALHDPALRLLLPRVEGVSEAEARSRLLDAMELRRLLPPPQDRPLRVLDVACGTGAELRGLALRLPRDTELFGIDLSRRMLEIGRRNLRRADVRAELCLGDAHALPYADAFFDLVVHVGGINAFSDKRRALAEMLRVAGPGAPIFVVDEQLRDGGRGIPLWKRGLFRVVTFWDAVQVAPTAELPEEASEVELLQPFDFYYALRFRRRASGPATQSARRANAPSTA
jgi:SAM-dependent methyltransferase